MKSRLFPGMRCVLTAVCAITGAGVYAQDCARVADPSKRLACYDSATKQPTQSKSKAKSEESLIQAAVRAALKDPESAKFGTLTVVSPQLACQTINARNGFGGYGGNRQAFVRKVQGSWVAGSIEDLTHEECQRAIQQ